MWQVLGEAAALVPGPQTAPQTAGATVTAFSLQDLPKASQSLVATQRLGPSRSLAASAPAALACVRGGLCPASCLCHSPGRCCLEEYVGLATTSSSEVMFPNLLLLDERVPSCGELRTTAQRLGNAGHCPVCCMQGQRAEGPRRSAQASQKEGSSFEAEICRLRSTEWEAHAWQGTCVYRGREPQEGRHAQKTLSPCLGSIKFRYGGQWKEEAGNTGRA